MDSAAMQTHDVNLSCIARQGWAVGDFYLAEPGWVVYLCYDVHTIMIDSQVTARCAPASVALNASCTINVNKTGVVNVISVL